MKIREGLSVEPKEPSFTSPRFRKHPVVFRRPTSPDIVDVISTRNVGFDNRLTRTVEKSNVHRRGVRRVGGNEHARACFDVHANHIITLGAPVIPVSRSPRITPRMGGLVGIGLIAMQSRAFDRLTDVRVIPINQAAPTRVVS
jgi:hypothetical protein